MNQLTEFVVQSKTLNVFTVNNLSIGRQGGAARSVHGVGYEVVMQLMEPYLYRYHHLVCDNYFTSPALCSTLFDKDTYMTSAVRVCRKGMPNSLKSWNFQHGVSVVKQNGPIMALCYRGRKTVIFKMWLVVRFNQDALSNESLFEACLKFSTTQAPKGKAKSLRSSKTDWTTLYTRRTAWW